MNIRKKVLVVLILCIVISVIMNNKSATYAYEFAKDTHDKGYKKGITLQDAAFMLVYLYSGENFLCFDPETYYETYLSLAMDMGLISTYESDEAMKKDMESIISIDEFLDMRKASLEFQTNY